MNKVCITGRLPSAPELRHTQSGKEVCSFDLAVTRATKEKETDWVPCVAWGSSAKFLCDYGDKGRMVALEGRIQTRSYEDKAGNKRKVVEVVADRVELVDGSRSNGSAPPVAPKDESRLNAGPDDFAVIDDSEDLPF